MSTPSNFLVPLVELRSSDDQPVNHFYHPTEGLILLILFIAAVIGNVGLITKLWTKSRCSQTVSNANILITQLAIADIAVALFCLLPNGIWNITGEFIAGDPMCKTLRYFQKFALVASTFVIVAIGLDRCLAIVAPLRIQVRLREIMQVTSSCAWISAAIYSVPQVSKNPVTFSYRPSRCSCRTITQSAECRDNEQAYPA